MKNQISLLNIEKYYGHANNQVHALQKLTLQINPGESLAIVGRSGCGKSTLLNILGGLDSPDSGSFFYGSDEITGLSKNKLNAFRKNNIGFVVQNFALIPDYTVYENSALPLKYQKMTRTAIRVRVQSLLTAFELEAKSMALPTELSGGQCQRVAIARAIAINPPILLADEPTGELDSATCENIMKIFGEIHHSGTTVVIVTHDQNVAAHCDRVIHMQDGKITASSAPSALPAEVPLKADPGRMSFCSRR